jgi:hypothetical protein
MEKTMTNYAVIITDASGNKKVVTKRIDGTPFLSATEASTWAERCRESFPKYEYEWAPIREVVR